MGLEALFIGVLVLAGFIGTIAAFFSFGRFLIWPFAAVLFICLSMLIGYAVLGDKISITLIVATVASFVGCILCTLDEDLDY